MKIKILFISLIFLISKWAFSQNDYTPIRCAGVIPDEFIDFTSDKIKLANENYEGRKKMEVSKRQYKRYNTESTYYIDYLLKSGLIVFGTPMNDYLNRVGKYVLESFPDIADEVRFYLVKSTSVNAFTNEQGIVFINIGLIAQLENEAQLAFIISHELIHYKYNHSFEAYKEEVKAESGWSEYRDLSNSSKKSHLLQYSRDNEKTADSLGFLEGYFPLKYSYDEALTVFDVLLYSNLPFDEVTFDTAFFDDENYSISPKCVLKEVDLISNPEDYDDHNLTHPNIKKRRSMMINIITSYENPYKAKYIISEKQFKQFQKEARFEMTNLYLTNLQYDKAFYNTYLLLRKFPESNYLKKSMAYCVYAMAIQKKLGNINDYMTSYKKIQGQSQRVNYLFKKIKTKEISALAVKLLWNYHKEHPEDKFINTTLNKALIFLIDENEIHFSSIYTPRIIQSDEIADSNSTQDPSDFKKLSKKEYDNLSKYDKIRYDKKYQKYYGVKGAKSKTLDTKNYYAVLTSETQDQEFKKLYTSLEDENRDEGQLVNVEKFVVVNPLFFKLKNDNLIVQGAEQHEMDYYHSMEDMAKRRNIDMTTLDILKIKSDEVDKFNDLALLSSWLDEYDDLITDENRAYMMPWLSNYTAPIQQKYKLRYIARTGLLEVDVTRTTARRLGYVFKAAILWQASPYFLVEAFSNEHASYQFFYCVDMETNASIISTEHQFEAKPSIDYLNAMNYNIMYQLKDTKK